MSLAIFDLDETLIGGDCSSLWSAHMATLGWVDAQAFIAKDHELMTLYAEGQLAMEDYMAFSLSPLVGRSLESVTAAVEAFVDAVIEPIIFADAIHCLNAHRYAGERLLIISASAHFLVSAIAARLGVDEVLAIDVESVSDQYTGRTEGVLTYREGKVTRLNGWLQENGETLEGACFYSDSRNDLPLLQGVDNPRVVNPDPVLREHAEQAGWLILTWR